MREMLTEGIKRMNAGNKFVTHNKLGKIYYKPGLLIFLKELMKFLKVETENRLITNNKTS